MVRTAFRPLRFGPGRRAWVAFAAGLALAFLLAEGVPAEPQRLLRVGSISLAIQDEISDFQPFANHLAHELAGQGITGARVVVVRNLDAMVEAVARGEVDVYVDSPFPIAEVERRTGLRPLLRRWKRGVASYQSLIFVRQDSAIHELDDLRGRLIAFDEPFSTSGYLLPRATLQASGQRLQEYARARVAVAPDRVGFVFSNDDENTVLWVLKGRADAGAIDDRRFEELLQERVADFRVIARSPSVPRQVVGVRAGLDPELVRALEAVLLRMHETAEGRRVLAEFHETARFDRFPEGARAGMGLVESLTKALAEDPR